VNAVQGFRDYEKDLQTELAEMRSQLTATPPGVSGLDYRAVNLNGDGDAERYPELKANETFSNLQQNLVDTRATDCAGARLFQRHRDFLQYAPGDSAGQICGGIGGNEAAVVDGGERV